MKVNYRKQIALESRLKLLPALISDTTEGSQAWLDLVTEQAAIEYLLGID